MANVKWIKIPTIFFDIEPITKIEKLSDKDEIIFLYLNLLCDSYKKSRKGEFSIANIDLTDDILFNIYEFDDIGKKLQILEKYKLIKRNKKNIVVFKFWEDKRNRNSFRYRNWRQNGITLCRKCHLKAHGGSWR